MTEPMKDRRFDRTKAELQLLQDILVTLESIDAQMARLVATLVPHAVTANLTGGDMPLEVGATETVTLTFTDAAGAAAAPPKGDGTGIVVTIETDNVNIASVGATTASGDTAVATATGVAVGDFNYTATVANTSGAALVDDDGTTAFVQPSPLADSVVAPPPPQATGAELSVPSGG
jgi:hypothetical protein